MASSVSGLVPTIPALSIGLGINSITKSSMVCTPLFLNDEPHTIGTIDISKVAALSAVKISFSVIDEGSSKNFSMIASSYSETASKRFSLQVVASSNMSSGISISS